MTTPLKLIRAILNTLKLRRERDSAVGLLHTIDRRTLQDIGMDHYGITSMVFPGDSDPGQVDSNK
jgi:hypothetical protein